MRSITGPSTMQRYSHQWRQNGKRIGLVPTMGALHAGHMALVEQARSEVDQLVVSIYVNPSQFGPGEDYKRYPRNHRADLKRCREAGADAMFLPANLYAKDHSTWIEEEDASASRCGASRPGHFRGVCTIVLKLFNIVQPHRAYFGEKDYQQLEVIQRMVRDLAVPVKVVGVPIVRDADGLALSSRNAYLCEAQREQALALSRGLKQAVKQAQPSAWLRRTLDRAAGLKVDYVERVGQRLFAAVYVGKTRLIDNIALPKK